MTLLTTSPRDLELSGDYEAFRTEDSAADIEIDIQWADSLERTNRDELFDSGSVWSVYQNFNHLLFEFSSPMLGCQPYKRLLVTNDFSRAQLLMNRNIRQRGFEILPFEYPVDELLVTSWLARGRGVEIHSCGLVDSENGGLLFVGHSGAGKSTTTRLWDSLRGVRILSDDRIILRESGDEYWMHGTPWHGEAGFASPERSQIKHIFIIEHGERNEFISLSRSRAVAELFARCFLPFYDERAIEFTLSFLQQIASAVPCYLYRFCPDSGAVERVLNFNG